MKIAVIATNLMTGVAIVIDVEADDETAALIAGHAQLPAGWRVLNVCAGRDAA
ncbi:hypothetical protein [Agromyces sp. NPDC058064]|uniref:hypothetical protein n=1 Tax=Agromyces sp. NPDC058064 TaxID=3346322 RepID=UPI0036D9398B